MDNKNILKPSRHMMVLRGKLLGLTQSTNQ